MGNATWARPSEACLVKGQLHCFDSGGLGKFAA